MIRNIKYFTILFLIGVAWFIITTLNDAGEFKTISPHFDGECISIPGAVGAEDITILKNGTALISSHDRRTALAGIPEQGALYSYNLEDETPKLVNLTADISFEFNPHGISLFENSDGSYRIAVINHTRNGHLIEIFDYRNDSLIHQQSIRDPLLISPNDLVLINASQMYVTNDHGSTSDWGKTLEEYLQLKRANVVFYDGSDFSIASENLGYANGINISLDGKILYVAETVGKKISMYSRNAVTNKLTFLQSVEIHSGVDNIELDEKGNMWIGSHPKLLTFTRHAKDADVLSPSQVFRLTPKAENDFVIEEIFLSKGDDLSGSSVGAVFGNTLLIGSVFESHFLSCTFNQKDGSN